MERTELVELLRLEEPVCHYSLHSTESTTLVPDVAGLPLKIYNFLILFTVKFKNNSSSVASTRVLTNEMVLRGDL